MAETEKEIKTGDKLPHKDVDLSVDANLKAAEKLLQTLGGKKEKKKPGGYLKCRYINGRPYWYRVFKVKTDGKWKNKEVYLGTRRPRETGATLLNSEGFF